MKKIKQNKNGNVIANLMKASVAISMCVFFAACGGDSSSSEPDSGDALQEDSSSSSDTDSIPTYKSEDDLPNCSKSRKGSLVLLNDDAMLCNDGKWQDLGKAYETSSDVPKCTKKREGETAFVLDEYQALVCNDGKWTEDEDVEDVVVKPEAKSSSSGKSNAKSSSSGKNESVSSSSGKEKANSSSSESSDEEDPEEYDDPWEEVTGSFTDSRDGKTYKTVRMGDQVWFAENLNYDDGHGLCPMLEAENCEKYGRLYNFEGRDSKMYTYSSSNYLSLCPEGWHVPDSLEWKKLISHVTSFNDGEPVGVSLKTTTGWYTEGDTVNIEGNGSPIGSEDSTRIGATRGTDRFGFSALPAGSCWDAGDCYVGDDTRFYFKGERGSFGGSYKLAFDKDDLIYSEDGAHGWISVRCLQNPVVEIDSIPTVDVVDTLVWMVEDLTHNGSAEFPLQDALYACPAGWRLPTERELMDVVQMSGKINYSFEQGKELKYFATNSYGNGISLTCSGNRFMCNVGILNSDDKSARRVRCVYEDVHITASKCECTSEVDPSNTSVTWSVSGCKKGSNKISGYSWDFGGQSAGVTISGAQATKTFDALESVTPLVKVNNKMKVGDEYVNIPQRLSCPTVRAGYTESAVIFTNDVRDNVELEGGITYTAVLDGGCDAGYGFPRITCQYSSGEPATVTVGDKSFSGSGWVVFGDLDSSICNEEFSISVSEDMECRISF